MSGGGGSSSPPPPTPEEVAAQEAATNLYNTQADLAREQWETYRDEGLPFLRKQHQDLLDRSDRAHETQVSQWERSFDRAGEQWEQNRAWTQDFIDRTKALESEIDRSMSPAALAVAEGRAASDVRAAFGQQRDGLRRMLGRYGMSPGSGRFASSLRSLALGEAGATAGARNDARVGVLERGLRNRMAAVGMARGLSVAPLGPSGTVPGRGLSAGGLANAYTDMAGQASRGLAGAASGFGTLAGNLQNQRLGIWQQQQANSNSFWGGVAGVAGSLGAAWILASDRRLKRNIKPIDFLPNGLMIYEFTFAADPTTVYSGLMADEVKRVWPEHVGENDDGFLTVDYAGVMREIVKMTPEVAHA